MMQIATFVGTVFIAISVIFLTATFRGYLISEGKMTISRRVWLRLALIFAVVGIGLYFLKIFIN
jgi:hypothetical protein